MVQNTGWQQIFFHQRYRKGTKWTLQRKNIGRILFNKESVFVLNVINHIFKDLGEKYMWNDIETTTDYLHFSVVSKTVADLIIESGDNAISK